MKSISMVARYAVRLPRRYLTLLESTSDHVRIRGTRYERFTFRGVPARRCDVIVAESIMGHRTEREEVVLEVTDGAGEALGPEYAECVLEIGDKLGRYDGAVRRRYAIRIFTDESQLAQIPRADLKILADSEELVVVVRPEDGASSLVDTYARLRSDLHDYDFRRLAGWHWRRYYTHLSDADAIPEIDAWVQEVNARGVAAQWTLAEANRAASRMLYGLSRRLGWRKLTSREREALALPADTGQWVHERDLPGYARPSNAVGVSDDPAEVPEDLEVLGWEIEEGLR